MTARSHSRKRSKQKKVTAMAAAKRRAALGVTRNDRDD